MSAPEFDGVPMTKREILIARQAVDEALHHAWQWIKSRGATNWPGSDTIRDELYPLTRPREVYDPVPGYHQFWRVVDGEIQWSNSPEVEGSWHSLYKDRQIDAHCCQWPMPERITMWADLLANPTEEVDA